MVNAPSPERRGATPEAGPLFGKAQRVLEEHKLEITKSWLTRVIAGIDDLVTLEAFPTQESIQTSVELIEGLAHALRDEAVLAEFEPGGRYYERAGALGLVGGTDVRAFQSLSQSLLAFENAIWDLLMAVLRREDRQLLALVVQLRQALHGVVASSTETFCIHSSSELDKLAHTDSLTGLHNRRYLLQQLDHYLESYKRYRHPFSILMLDLDNLKAVNDSYGHVAGDAALRHLATLMTINVRDVDIPGRMGGDEFLIVMPETEKDAVEIVGNRISDSLAKTKLKTANSLISLEVSVGSASCPEDGLEAEELLQEADAALYRTKQLKAQKRS
jgi:diguanylate cyclase (GGDEF)-like protein